MVGIFTAKFEGPFKGFGLCVFRVAAVHFFFTVQSQVFARQGGRHGFRVGRFAVVTLLHKGGVGLLQRTGITAFVAGYDGIEFGVARGFRAFMAG